MSEIKFKNKYRIPSNRFEIPITDKSYYTTIKKQNVHELFYCNLILCNIILTKLKPNNLKFFEDRIIDENADSIYIDKKF